METYGVAEIAHLWPAQQVLDYGEAVLGSLRPGMVYVGGTDAGRFIPTLLNETSATASVTSFSPRTPWPTAPTWTISAFSTGTG